MTHLLITIAIPAYNNEKTIQKTIDSCLTQNTNIDYEILVLDDASTDNTPKILEAYEDKRIRVVTLKSRVPLIANHNECLKHALGQYIIFCHADDTLEAHAINFFKHKLETRLYPKKYIVWGHSMFRDFSDKAIKQAGFSYNEIVVGEYAPLMFFYGGLTPSGTLYSRESFLTMGGFIEPTMNAAPSDMTTMIYLAMNGFRFEMTDEMLLYRENSSTAISNAKLDVYLEELDNAFKPFISQTDIQKLSKLIILASNQKNKPYNFLYTMAQETNLHLQIKRIILRNLIKYPWRIQNPIVKKILKRVM